MLNTPATNWAAGEAWAAANSILWRPPISSHSAVFSCRASLGGPTLRHGSRPQLRRHFAATLGTLSSSGQSAMPLAVEHEHTEPRLVSASPGRPWPAAHASASLAAIVLLLAVSAAGCLNWLPASRPAARSRLCAAADHANNPVLMPNQNRDLVFETVVDVVDDYFKIDQEMPVRLEGDVLVEGQIDTYPRSGSTLLEPWGRDAANFYERARRHAAIDPAPGAGPRAFRPKVAFWSTWSSSRNWRTCCGPKPARPAGPPTYATTTRCAAISIRSRARSPRWAGSRWVATWPWSRRSSWNMRARFGAVVPLPPQAMAAARQACRRRAVILPPDWMPPPQALEPPGSVPGSTAAAPPVGIPLPAPPRSPICRRRPGNGFRGAG